MLSLNKGAAHETKIYAGRRETGKEQMVQVPADAHYWATTEYLRAAIRASYGTSVDSDGDALRLDARLFRDRNLEHAIGVARLDRFSLR